MKKISKYLYACLPFLMIMGIVLLVPNIIVFFMMIYHMALGFGQGTDAALNAYMNNLNLISVIMYTCALIPAALWYYHAFFKKRKRELETGSFGPSSIVPVGFLALGVSHSMSLLFILLAVFMPHSVDNYNDLMENSGMLTYSVLWVFSTLILPPVVEELTFRGLTMNLFRKAGASYVLANFLQALLFGIFHMNLVQGIYAFLLGFLMGYLVQKYHTLLASMTFHAFFNLFGTFLMDLEDKYFNNYLSFLAMLIGLLLTGFCLYLISRHKPSVRKYGNSGLRQTPYDDFHI